MPSSIRSSLTHRFSYTCVLTVSKLLEHLPYSWIHSLGRFFGSLIYYTYPKFRKRALSNLSLASSLNLSQKELKTTALKSLQSIAITFLEYPKLKVEKNIETLVKCINPEKATALIEKGQGVIFFCAHQANWELFFLEGNSRMKGVAIGRPIRNTALYNYILKIRQRFGGQIIPPKQALKEGLRALKSGQFLGIVGDQGHPDSPFSCEFLGRTAYTTTAPALLAYKTGTPLIVATMKREQGRYFIEYSDPLIPDQANDLKDEVDRLMTESLKILEKSILEKPHEWMWIHNKFKQETASHVFYRFRQDSILFLLKNQDQLDLSLIRKLYPKAFITLSFKDSTPTLENFEVVAFDSLLTSPLSYRYKLVYNFTDDFKLTKFFLKASAHEVILEKTLNHLIKKRELSLPTLLGDKLICAIARNPTEYGIHHAP